jgi:hypothetical protein
MPPLLRAYPWVCRCHQSRADHHLCLGSATLASVWDGCSHLVPPWLSVSLLLRQPCGISCLVCVSGTPALATLLLPSSAARSQLLLGQRTISPGLAWRLSGDVYVCLDLCSLYAIRGSLAASNRYGARNASLLRHRRLLRLVVEAHLQVVYRLSPSVTSTYFFCQLLSVA